MTTVADIEAAIEQLSPEDMAGLMERLEESRFLQAASGALFQMLDEEEGDDGPQWLEGDAEQSK